MPLPSIFLFFLARVGNNLMSTLPDIHSSGSGWSGENLYPLIASLSRVTIFKWCWCLYSSALPKMFQLLVGSLVLEKINVIKALVHTIYPILTCPKVLITYGQLSKQKILRAVKSQRGQHPKFIEYLNHVEF